MTKKKILLIGGIVALCLALCLCLVMCNSGKSAGDEDVPGTTGTNIMTYTIEVTSHAGKPLEGIGVYVYEDKTLGELVWFAKTDADGKIEFEDIASDNFVAVLQDVPAGYLVEETYRLKGELTQIVLESGLMEGDLSTLNYKLGDMMLDFTVTDPEGKEYKLSEVLKEKKAVILNFWYLQCDPCKKEFPYLQTAYEEYEEDVLVLALNAVEQDNEAIAEFRKENGYTFPMMAADPNWAKALQLTAYPTTVVVDRYGYISIIHTGTITEEGLFEAIMEYYSSDDYEQTTFRNIEDLQDEAGYVQTVGTPDNPVQIGATPSFQVTVQPGEEVHYDIYRLTTTMYMSINNENAYALYNGQRYNPTNGRVSLAISAEDTSSACRVVFGNTGKEPQVYTVTMGSAAGTMGNPITMSLGDVTVNVGAGNNTGVWYTYTPSVNGLYTIEVNGVTAGVKYSISLTTLTPAGGSAQRNISDDGAVNEETGKKIIYIDGYAGRAISISVGTLPDGSNTYPAATFKLNAKLEEGKTSSSAQEKKYKYSVNVTDENRNPLSNVAVNVTMNEGEQPKLHTTNADGIVTFTDVAGSYPVVVAIPEGYTGRTTKFVLTDAKPSASVKFDTIEKETYTITVLDASGNPIQGAMVTIGNVSVATNANGVAVITTVKGSYTAIIKANGYLDFEVPVSPENKETSESLQIDPNANNIDYTVTALDYYGNPMAGITLTFKQEGTAIAEIQTDAGGVANISLNKGTYTVGVPSGDFTDETNNILTAENPSATIQVICGPNAGAGEVYGDPVNYVTAGVTYVTTQQAETANYILFRPTAPGVYKMSILSDAGTATYHGTNLSYVQDMTHSTVEHDEQGKWFTFNVKPSNFDKDGNAAPFLLSTTGTTGAIIQLEWISAPILNEVDLELKEYQRKMEPTTQNITAPSGKKLVYVDVINGKTEDFVLEKGSNGTYLINGKTAYIHLGSKNNVKVPYLCLSNFIGVTDSYAANPFYWIVRDSNGTALYKENLASLLIDYCNCTKESAIGLYPVTDDLIYMLQKGGENKGWWNFSDIDYIFKDDSGNPIENINTEIAWMFALCWFE